MSVARLRPSSATAHDSSLSGSQTSAVASKLRQLKQLALVQFNHRDQAVREKRQAAASVAVPYLKRINQPNSLLLKIPSGA